MNRHLALFYFNDTATTEIYTLSLHDALPISPAVPLLQVRRPPRCVEMMDGYTPLLGVDSRAQHFSRAEDRKSTRLNSSHQVHLVCRLLLEKKKPAES